MNLGEETLQRENFLRSLEGIKILLVDDDSDTRNLFRFILGDCGAETTVAGSVQEALETIEAWQPDVLITDINMPDEDGHSLLRKVRNLDANNYKQIPAIAITGHYYKDIVSIDTKMLDFQIYMTKPVDIDELVGAVVSLTEKKLEIK